MTEMWKEVNGAGGYFVSTEGRVRHGDKELTIQFNAYPRYGYVVIKKKKYRIHRLVASTFIPNPDGLSDVNHLDGNKENNSLENLEWTSHRNNMRHASCAGLLRGGRAKRPIIAFYSEGIQTYPSITEAARIAHKPVQTIYAALRRGGAAGGVRYAYQSETERLIV